jgi:hypothetical protein
MVDYNLKDKLILECLRKLGALDVKTTIECGYLQDTKDPILVRGTSEKKRLLLTKDRATIDEFAYPPCSHGGIIIIDHKRPTPDMVCDWMKSFIQSGQRAYAKHHVTYLNNEGFRIKTHNPEPITGAFK